MVWSLAQPVSCEQHFAVPMTRRCIAMHSFATFSSRPISRTSERRQQIGRSSGCRSGQFYCRFLSHGFKSETVKKFKTLGEFVLLLIGCFWDIKVLRKTKVLGLVVLVLWTQIQRWLPFVRLWFLGEFLISCTAKQHSVGSARALKTHQVSDQLQWYATQGQSEVADTSEIRAHRVRHSLPAVLPCCCSRSALFDGVLARSRRRRTTQRGSARLGANETKDWATLTLQISACRRKSNLSILKYLKHVN